VEDTKLVSWILLKNQQPGQQIQMHGPAHKESNSDEAAPQNKPEGYLLLKQVLVTIDPFPTGKEGGGILQECPPVAALCYFNTNTHMTMVYKGCSNKDRTF
jgi:hypothetical protein